MPAAGGWPRRQTGQWSSQPFMENVIDFINLNRDRYLDELKTLLAIPSISALPEHKDDVRRCAGWCVDEMTRIGLQNVRLMETPGNPVVYGDWLGASGAPTILFYGHYDVQPVDPVELWESPPFEATIREGRPTTRARCSCTSRRSRPTSSRTVGCRSTSR
jgi:acetylornithine deacetylase/succinyl-diaminopimelate desuccinylase-like protein